MRCSVVVPAGIVSMGGCMSAGSGSTSGGGCSSADGSRHGFFEHGSASSDVDVVNVLWSSLRRVVGSAYFSRGVIRLYYSLLLCGGGWLF